jgi:carbonic anhydrase/acetyltransferase-like protein (isoleucine patch superfamily)
MNGGVLMTVNRWLLRRTLLILMGLLIGTAFLTAIPEADLSGLPAVSSGNQWGQHTPRLPPGTADLDPEVPVPRAPGTAQTDPLPSPTPEVPVPRAPETVQPDLMAAPTPEGSIPSEPDRLHAEPIPAPDVPVPNVHEAAHLDLMSSVTGNVDVAAGVSLGPFASVRGDGGHPIHIGSGTILKESVVINAPASETQGHYMVGGRPYAIYVGEDVLLSSQAQVQGPAWIEDHVIVGMQALVVDAHIGRGAVVAPAAKVIGVTIPSGRQVAAGLVITAQAAADQLPWVERPREGDEPEGALVPANQDPTESMDATDALEPHED